MTSVLVFIPAYNVDRYIGEAIQSILNQTYEDFILLVISDGSSDRTLEIANSFHDDRIIVWSQEHSGVSSTANRAIKFAVKENFQYFFRLDGDDIALPTRIERQIKILESNSYLVACSSNCYYIDESGENIIGSSTVPISPRLIHLEVRLGYRGLIQGACAFKTKALNDVGGYRPKFSNAEDTDLFLRLTEKFKVSNSHEFLTKIRIRKTSLSISNSALNNNCRLFALDCAKKRRRDENEEKTYLEYKESQSIIQRIILQREIFIQKYWRRGLEERNPICLLVASLIDPFRVMLRIIRFIDLNFYKLFR